MQSFKISVIIHDLRTIQVLNLCDDDDPCVNSCAVGMRSYEANSEDAPYVSHVQLV